jgi:hypothetical protein
MRALYPFILRSRKGPGEPKGRGDHALGAHNSTRSQMLSESPAKVVARSSETHSIVNRSWGMLLKVL